MDHPNIVFIICHDLGTHLNCYGDWSAKTPNVDSIAGKGVRFDNYYATAPQCSPSRGSILTGRYPHSNGLMGLNNYNNWNLNDNEVGFPEALRDAGYETRCFGTWHINHDPKIFGIEQRVPDKPADEIATLVQDYLARRKSDKPFFAYIGFFEPHRDFGTGKYEPEDPQKVMVPSYLPDNMFTRKDLAQFHGAIREMDRAVGRILQSLYDNGLSDNTMIIFTSDHGIAFPRAKCTLFDPGLKTPLIIRWPGVLPENKTFSEMMSNTDFMPSLLDMLDIPIPENVHGRSFLPLIKGEEYQPHSHIFAEKTYHCIYDPMRAIRTNDFKYIISFEDRPYFVMPTDVDRSLTAQGMDSRDYFRLRPAELLYDLREDPNEVNNLAGDPRYKDVLKDLKSRLMGFLEQTNDPILDGPVPEPPPCSQQ